MARTRRCTQRARWHRFSRDELRHAEVFLVTMPGSATAIIACGDDVIVSVVRSVPNATDP
jgi:hypothetical protein